jgi:hypothetical protein
MTYKNTYRFIDALPKFFKGYNDTVHSATGMAPSKVTDTDVLKIWRKMRAKQTSVRRAPAKFKVGQHVRISKEKLKFAKGVNKTTQLKYSRYIRLCSDRQDLCMNSWIC